MVKKNRTSDLMLFSLVCAAIIAGVVALAVEGFSLVDKESFRYIKFYDARISEYIEQQLKKPPANFDKAFQK